MEEKHLVAEERFYDVMRRVRKLDIDTQMLESNMVSPAQMTLLDWLVASPGCGVQAIAKGLTLTPPTVSVHLRKLEKCKLVERKPNLQDKRSVQFFLTEQGLTIQKQIQNLHLHRFRLLLSSLSIQEQDDLLQLLERAINTVENEPLS